MLSSGAAANGLHPGTLGPRARNWANMAANAARSTCGDGRTSFSHTWGPHGPHARPHRPMPLPACLLRQIKLCGYAIGYKNSMRFCLHKGVIIAGNTVIIKNTATIHQQAYGHKAPVMQNGMLRGKQQVPVGQVLPQCMA